jgi:hypothetical protein
VKSQSIPDHLLDIFNNTVLIAVKVNVNLIQVNRFRRFVDPFAIQIVIAAHEFKRVGCPS